MGGAGRWKPVWSSARPVRTKEKRRGRNHWLGEDRKTKKVSHWSMPDVAKKRRPRPRKAQGMSGPQWTDTCKCQGSGQRWATRGTKPHWTACHARLRAPGSILEATYNWWHHPMQKLCLAEFNPTLAWRRSESLEAEAGEKITWTGITGCSQAQCPEHVLWSETDLGPAA